MGATADRREEGGATFAAHTGPVHALRYDMCELLEAAGVQLRPNLAEEAGDGDVRRPVRIPAFMTFSSEAPPSHFVRSMVSHTLITLLLDMLASLHVPEI